MNASVQSILDTLTIAIWSIALWELWSWILSGVSKYLDKKLEQAIDKLFPVYFVPAFKHPDGTVTVANYITDGKERIYLPALRSFNG